jgi:catechol 2,3-dioxygenase-like lactoylglutathione lyase family enzyme
MLGSATVQPMLPVKNLETAERFYENMLGLTRVEEEPGDVAVYQSGGSKLVVYTSKYAGTNKGTAAAWHVNDVEETVEELRAKGVRFEQYDNLPGVTRHGDIHVAGDTKMAWFKDPDGNILSLEGSR